MPDPLLALGVLASLASPAHAGGDAPSPDALDLSYELTRASGKLVVKIYAKNTGAAPLVVDDNPYVRAATLMVDAEHAVGLSPEIDEEMFSRSGPMRRWITLKPGERLLVGTSDLLVPEGQPVDQGRVLLTVEAVTTGGRTARSGEVQLQSPGT